MGIAVETAAAGSGADAPLATPVRAGPLRADLSARTPPSATRPIIGLLLIAFLATLLVAVWGAYESYLRTWDDARDQVKDDTHILTEQAATLFSTHVASLQYVANLAEESGWDGLSRNRRFHDRINDLARASPEVFGLWLMDPQGKLVANSGQWPVSDVSLADRDYFRVHVQGWRGVYAGQQTVGRITGQVFLPLSVRINHPDGSFAGVAQISLRPDYFISFYRSLFAGEPKSMMLLRDDGAVLVREPVPADLHADADFYPQFLFAQADRDGLFRLKSPVDGVDRLYGRRKLPNLPITVVYGLDTGPLVAEWRNRLLYNAALTLPILLATLALTRMALRRSRALMQAERALRQTNAVLEERVADRTRHLDQALADREMLVRDTHHRVKNNLQVVSSLLQLQAALNPPLRPLLDDALHRIQAMGLLHEQLHQASKLDSVRLDMALRTLMGEIDAIHQGPPPEELIGLPSDAPARPISLDLDLAAVEMGVAAAVPLILIVNEVVSNAYKHAFPGGRSGRVRVHLAHEGDDGVLEIADDGVGLPLAVAAPDGAKRRRSLGMTLVEAFIRQLGGRGGYEAATDGAIGTRFCLRFPLPAGA